MKTNQEEKSFRIVAVNEEQMEGVNHHQFKLNLQNIHSCSRLLYYKLLNLFISSFIYDTDMSVSFI